MLVRPSLVLQVKLTSDDYSDAQATETMRSYIHIAQSIVSELEDEDRADGNTMRLCIRLRRPYWDASDPEAQKLWEGSMSRWLVNATRNLSNAMHNFNEVEHPSGSHNVRYEWADYEFDDHMVFRIKVDGENRITSDAPRMIEQARDLLCQQAFGEKKVVRIQIPSKDSYAEQLRFAEEHAEQAVLEEESLAEVDDAFNVDECAGFSEATETGGEGQPVEQLSDGYADVSECRLEDDEKGNVNPDDEDGLDAQEEEASRALAFDIDFGVWGIEFEDGSILEFDSASA